jgi:hypothetical protein
MAFPQPPAKIVPFNSGPVASYDVGRQFDEVSRSSGTIIQFLRTIVRDDGRLTNGSVGIDQLDPAAAEELASRAKSAIDAMLLSVQANQAQVQARSDAVSALQARIVELQGQVASGARALAQADELVRAKIDSLDSEIATRVAQQVSNALAAGLLGPNAGGFYGVDAQGASATAQDYAQVSIEWAEHMPDTIPPNILAINAITGDHWSSRWWANRAASAFGMLAWWYMGAFPAPGPPTTPLTPTGQPIPPGAMYFDTTSGTMMVWTGSTWVNLAQGPAPAFTSSLYYLAINGQTAFPLTTGDRFSNTFTFNQTNPEGLQALVNGVRLWPTQDYNVTIATSTVIFLRPLPANAAVTFDILAPVSRLAPSGSANTVLVSPIVPDGATTTFTGLKTAASGTALNVVHNEELLVSVNGIIQQPASSYAASGASITFAEAPEANAVVYMVWFGPGP